jgi:hypothetical protein
MFVALLCPSDPSLQVWLLHEKRRLWRQGRLHNLPGDIANVWRGTSLPTLSYASARFRSFLRWLLCSGCPSRLTQLYTLQLIAVWCIDAWHKLGRPAELRLLELGPGRGTLMADFLRVFCGIVLCLPFSCFALLLTCTQLSQSSLGRS